MQWVRNRTNIILIRLKLRIMMGIDGNDILPVVDWTALSGQQISQNLIKKYVLELVDRVK